MRNVARKSSQTNYVFLTDIDIIPSKSKSKIFFSYKGPISPNILQTHITITDPKKYIQAVSLFCTFGICECKSCQEYVGEIDPKCVKDLVYTWLF